MGRAPVVELVAADVERVAYAFYGVVACAVGRGVGVAGVRGNALDGEVGVVVVYGEDGFAAREVVGRSGALPGGHSHGVAHEVFLPYGEAVEPADTLVDGLGPNGLVGRCLEVEQRMLALHGEALVACSLEDGLVVGVAVAADIVVSVYAATLDVNLYRRPFLESFSASFRVGGVNNVVEGIRGAIDDVEASFQACARLGVGDEVVAHAPGQIECGIGGDIRVNKHIEGFEPFGEDAGWVAHIRSSSALHERIPIAGIAVGFVGVYAEVFLVGRPALVLELYGYGGHKVGHTGFGQRRGEGFVAHSLILWLKLCGRGVFKESVEQAVDRLAGVGLAGVCVFEPSRDGAILWPVGRLIVGQRVGINDNLRRG